MIDELIEKVREASLSEKNIKRRTRKPKVEVLMESPIAWTILFNYDYNKYITDPLFFIEQFLRQQLWKWENIDDDIPISLNIQLPFGWPEFTFKDTP